MADLVLMIEDDPDDRELTMQMIKEISFDVPVKFASSGHEAYELFKQERPRIVLIDYNLEPVNGLQLLKTFKEDKLLRDIPVIILADNADKNLLKSCYAAGAATVVKKPSSDEATRNKIKIFFQYWFSVAEI